MNRSVSEYIDKFGEMPYIPMIQCSGEDDERPKPPERGYHYVKSSFDKKNSLLVVDNDYPDNLFMKNAMVKQKEVVKDIPNITIGEYVIRVRDCERPPEDHRPPHHRRRQAWRSTRAHARGR